MSTGAVGFMFALGMAILIVIGACKLFYRGYRRWRAQKIRNAFLRARGLL
jgi:hypothetical protein